LALTPTNDPANKRAATDEVFLREVDDAVRASDLTNFWKRYGRWLLGLIVLGLAAFGGWIFYQNQLRAENEKQGEEYIAAIDKLNAGDEKGARAMLAKIAKVKQPAYRAMAQITEANILAETDLKKAAAAYGKVAGDATLPGPFRDLALLRQTTAEFDTLQPQQIVDRLKPMATPGHPMFGSAGEMTAIAYMNMGKDNLAGPIFAQIAKQKDLPESLRGRATQMAGSLGIDAVQLEEKKETASGATNAPAKGGTK
jgi:hypothetical protein